MSEIYNPTQSEVSAIMDSYLNLGGPKDLGVDFNTWKGTMGIGDVDKGFLGNTMDFLGSDGAKNAIGLGGLAMSGLSAFNAYKAGKQAKKQWEAENARANEIMAMNREKYQTYKADKARLNSGYSGSGLAASGGN